MRLLRNRILLKSFAVFFAIEFLASAVLPSVTYALTAGPSAPEFSSFEPVDTTDMVNLATGDFIYNTPVIEVPGPEGGYPLSLSYHAGIKLDQEASWVGLGFTLNPGAINRTVQGYADDNVATRKQVKDYWGGGNSVTKTYNFGLSGYGVGVGYTLAKTTDTYKGFSKNSYTDISVDPVAVGLSIAAAQSETTKPTAEQPNPPAASAVYASSIYGGASQMGFSTSLGISIDSKGVKANASVAGISLTQKNNFAGHISSYTTTRSPEEIAAGSISQKTISISYANFSASYSRKDFYTRYWSDEAQALFTYGALYPGMANSKIGEDHYSSDWGSEFTSYAFDTYNMMDVPPTTLITDPIIINPLTNSVSDDINDPTKQLGGSFPAYDRFDVLGQGVGGIIQPYIFENGDLHGQNFYERNRFGHPATSAPSLEHKTMRKFSDKKVDFRFVNDFSNALTVTPAPFKAESNDVDSHAIAALPEGFNFDTNTQRLAGSKHIEWFSNEEIANGSAGDKGFVDFYEARSERLLQFDVYENYMQPEVALPFSGELTYGRGEGSFTASSYAASGNPYTDLNLETPQFRSLKARKADLRKKIGGFMITNETGVTYHYALPVYNYNEYTRSKLKNPVKGTSTFKEYKNDDPYAYTWLLTAVTGPDYVDRNNSGTVDDEDWGYWVKFDYGRWADSYQWRTPHTGYVSDLESESLTFSYGIKELYYLDAVETRSHKAIFIKSKKKDGKGVTSRLEGGSKPRNFRLHFSKDDYNGFPANSNGNPADLDLYVSPVSTMKLDAIYLFQKDALGKIKFDKKRGEKYMEASADNPHTYFYTGTPYSYEWTYSTPKQSVKINSEDYVPVKYHNGDMVYDDDDIYNLPQFKSNALRIIEFNTDYSLSAGVANSIGYFSDPAIDANSISGSCQPDSEGVCDDLESRIGQDFEWPDFYCDGVGQSEGAPVCCNYSQESFYGKQGTFSHYRSGNGLGCASAATRFRGEAIRYKTTGKLTLKSLEFLGKGGADLMPSTEFLYAKDPAYVAGKYDEWGFYKSDYNAAISDHTRRITSESAADADAWSLTSINLPLGSQLEIQYEPQQFVQSVYNNFSVFSISKLEPGSNADAVKLTFKEKPLVLSKWFAVGNPVDFKSLFAFAKFNEGENHDMNDEDAFNSASAEIYMGNSGDIITSVETDAITIQSAGLRALLSRNLCDLPLGLPCDSYFASGFIKVNDPEPMADGSNPKFSGGIRVRSLSVVGDNGQNRSEFEYVDPISGKPSGVVAYSTFNVPSGQFPANVDFFDRVMMDDDKKNERRKLLLYQSRFQSFASQPFLKVLTFLNEAPPPTVIYEYVTQRNYFNDTPADAYSIHHFKVFKEEMISRESQDFSSPETTKKLVTVQNNAIDVSNILSTKIYSNQGTLLKTKTFGYLYDDTNELYEQETLNSKQGVVEQSFQKYIRLTDYTIDYLEVTDWEVDFGKRHTAEVDVIYDKEKMVISKRRDRSNALTSTTEIDHRLGMTTTTQNHGFNFFSGQPTKIATKDSYGNQFMAVTDQAYKHYPKMGLKIFDPLNKHMLTQESASYLYQVDPTTGDYLGLMSATVQTWSDRTKVLNITNAADQQDIFRKQSTYTWNGDMQLNSVGLYPYSDFMAHPFNWSVLSANDKWQKTSEVTLYDVFSTSLEAKNLNDQYVAVRKDKYYRRVLASTSNARYDEMAYSGAENLVGNTEPEGGVSRGDGNPSRAFKHTGDFGLVVATGKKGFNFTLRSSETDLTKKYRASVWVYAPGEAELQNDLDKIELYYIINNNIKQLVHPVLQKSKSKSWYLLSMDIVPEGSNDIFIGVRNNTQRGIYFDDFRVHPLNASLMAYVYDPLTGELSYILDANNFYTHFEYDGIGRLVRSGKEQLNFDYGDGKESYKADVMLKEVKYNFGKGNQ